jgi:succinate dehydrogenase/fumarate reductase-like Fe-S protein
MSGRIAAYWLLAQALVTTWLTRWFGRGPTGLAHFQQNYAADRLPPVAPEERKRMPAFSRCIACGRCEEGDAAAVSASGGAFPGTMALMLASSRSMPDFDAAAAAFAWVTDDDLARKERICPTGVPMREVAAFVRSKTSHGS